MVRKRLAAHDAGNGAVMPPAAHSVMPLAPMARPIGRRRRFLKVRRISDRTMIDAEHALDAADHATDGRADNRADRTGDPVAFLESMRSATRDALCLRGQRRRRHCEEYAREYQSPFHHIPFVSCGS